MMTWIWCMSGSGLLLLTQTQNVQKTHSSAVITAKQQQYKRRISSWCIFSHKKCSMLLLQFYTPHSQTTYIFHYPTFSVLRSPKRNLKCWGEHAFMEIFYITGSSWWERRALCTVYIVVIMIIIIIMTAARFYSSSTTTELTISKKTKLNLFLRTWLGGNSGFIHWRPCILWNSNNFSKKICSVPALYANVIQSLLHLSLQRVMDSCKIEILSSKAKGNMLAEGDWYLVSKVNLEVFGWNVQSTVSRRM